MQLLVLRQPSANLWAAAVVGALSGAPGDTLGALAVNRGTTIDDFARQLPDSLDPQAGQSIFLLPGVQTAEMCRSPSPVDSCCRRRFAVPPLSPCRQPQQGRCNCRPPPRRPRPHHPPSGRQPCSTDSYASESADGRPADPDADTADDVPRLCRRPAHHRPTAANASCRRRSRRQRCRRRPCHLQQTAADRSSPRTRRRMELPPTDPPPTSPYRRRSRLRQRGR